METHTLDALVRRRASESVQRAMLGYPKSRTDPTDLATYTAREFHLLTERAARYLLSQSLSRFDDEASEVVPVAAVLGNSTLSYLLTIAGLSRLGYTVLVLSPRLSVSAYLSLLETVGCNIIVRAGRFGNITAELQNHAKNALRVFELVNHESLPPLKESGCNVIRFLETINHPTASDHTAFIMHSSGSTGLPKPIFHKQKRCIDAYANAFHLSPSFVTLPLYHTYGLSSFYRALTARTLVYLFDGETPITAERLSQTVRVAKPELVSAVPYALKLMSEDQSAVELLAKCEMVTYHGSPCPDELGDYLVNQGVHLVGHLGSTEAGALMSSERPREDKLWNYFTFFPQVLPYIQMKPVGDGLFETVLLDGLPAKVLSNSDDPPNSLHTRDLFSPHPVEAGRWKFEGRMDDRVTLMNGEKVLPVPIEGRLRSHPAVREAVVFGVGRAVPGLLAFRSEYGKGLTDKEFVDSIWDTVKEANEHAEAFSQIQKEMIVPLSAEEEYPRTDKGSMIRAKVYDFFADNIEAAYRSLELQNGSVKRLRFDQVEEIEDWLIKAFQENWNIYLDRTQDFFDAGVDSLKAIQIRTRILRHLDIRNDSSFGSNIVYDCGNIRSLARYLHASQTNNSATIETRGPENTEETMAALVQKYSVFLRHVPTSDTATKHSVVLTGATGTLGAYLLSSLLQRGNVSRVYCLVRASSEEAASMRVTNSLRERNLPVLSDKVVALPSDLTRQDLGLPSDILSEILSSLTLIFHCAWTVNFNLRLESFELLLLGTQNLINLSLSAKQARPARFFFASSVSTATGMKTPADVPEMILADFASAQNMGYAKSKMVAEHIVHNAATKGGALARVLRVGQIAGDGETGVWNDTESIPLIIRSALTVGSLPSLDEMCSWLPVDHLASITLDLSGVSGSHNPATRDADHDLVYNLVNPVSFHWTCELLPALRGTGMKFETVPTLEWVRRLKESPPDADTNPSVKLLSFYEGRYTGDDSGRNGLRFLTRRSLRDSATMRESPHLVRDGYIEKFVKAWLRKWKI